MGCVRGLQWVAGREEGAPATLHDLAAIIIVRDLLELLAQPEGRLAAAEQWFAQAKAAVEQALRARQSGRAVQQQWQQLWRSMREQDRAGLGHLAAAHGLVRAGLGKELGTALRYLAGSMLGSVWGSVGGKKSMQRLVLAEDGTVKTQAQAMGECVSCCTSAQAHRNAQLLSTHIRGAEAMPLSLGLGGE